MCALFWLRLYLKHLQSTILKPWVCFWRARATRCGGDKFLPVLCWVFCSSCPQDWAWSRDPFAQTPQTCHSSSAVDWAAPIFKPLLPEGLLHLKRASCLRVFFQHPLFWHRAWPGTPQPPADGYPSLLLRGPKIYPRVVVGDPKPCSRPKWWYPDMRRAWHIVGIR